MDQAPVVLEKRQILRGDDAVERFRILGPPALFFFEPSRVFLKNDVADARLIDQVEVVLAIGSGDNHHDENEVRVAKPFLSMNGLDIVTQGDIDILSCVKLP